MPAPRACQCPVPPGRHGSPSVLFLAQAKKRVTRRTSSPPKLRLSVRVQPGQVLPPTPRPHASHPPLVPTASPATAWNPQADILSPK
eukprot:gene23723-biopygen16370